MVEGQVDDRESMDCVLLPKQMFRRLLDVTVRVKRLKVLAGLKECK